VRGLTGRLGRSGASSRRRVDRCLRGREVPGVALPRSPDRASSPSRSPMSSSSLAVSSPAWAAWSRAAWASARCSIKNLCRSSGGGGSGTGSWSRCQPSRHWVARSVLARSAQGGHKLARVAPQGMRICSSAPVCWSMRRTWIGRTHAPWASATARMAARVVGWAIRSALVVWSVTGSLRPASQRHAGGLAVER
jgi:hypothetical protein